MGDNYTISKSITLSSIMLSEITNWPIKITNGTKDLPVIVSFDDDITLNNINQYFIINSDYIIINGNDHNIVIDSVYNYPGLIQNGTGDTTSTSSIINGYSNIIIENIIIKIINNSTLSENNGWVCQILFGNNSNENKILNCSSYGDISYENSGGILGTNAAFYGSIIIDNCSSYGDIIGSSAGGICGYGAATYGSLTVSNSYSFGKILGKYAGGICGDNCGLNGLNEITIIKCYSNGDILGEGSGGICGGGFGFGSTSSSINSIQFSYSTGEIYGDCAGGICGFGFGLNSNSNSTNSILSSYSTGNIYGNNSAGIVAGNVGYNSSSSFSIIKIENCYTLGNILNTSAGSICGGMPTPLPNLYPIPSNINLNNCYCLYGPLVSINLQTIPIETNCYISTNNIWNDLDAQTYLLDTPKYNTLCDTLIKPVGKVWTDIDPFNNNIPWLLSNLGYTPYSTNLSNTYTQIIKQGNNTNKALKISSWNRYFIVSINNEIPLKYPGIKINNITGEIIFDNLIVDNTYSIKILEQLNYPNYTMTDFELIIDKNNIISTIYYHKLKKNNKLIIKLNNNYSKYQLINNPENGIANIIYNELIYTPNNNYIGLDDFTLKCINVKTNIINLIKFEIF